MRRFYFLRHGQTNWNAENRVQGHQPDVYLTPHGQQQSRAAAHVFKKQEKPTVVISSPLLRAQQTAQIIADELGLKLEIHPDLTERHMGSWQGRKWEDILQEHNLPPHWHESPPYPEDAESYEQMDTRAIQALEECLKTYPSPPLIVAHGGIFKAFSKILTGTTLRSDNAIPYHFHQQKEGWNLTVLEEKN